MTVTAPLATGDLHWLRAFVDPQIVADWSLRDWDRVVRLARRHRLLARLDSRIDQAGLADVVPSPVRRHLVAARHLSRARTRALLWTIERLPGMLDDPSYPLVLLKGAAYMAQDLPIAEGRLPSDLDILVPQRKLPEVAFRLKQAGWREPALDEHDRRYYLEWSHELPPLQHSRHAVELDAHHNILPQRAGRTIDATLIVERVVPSRWPSWQVLSPVDQLLHSAAHLFHDAEPRDRVRDVVDLDGLFRHFGTTPAFWVELPQRAQALGLMEPLALACHFTRLWLDTPLPASFLAAVADTGPGRAQLRWLLPLMAAVLAPSEPDQPDPLRKRLATMMVLARYHWNRLPLHILLPHLWRKWRKGVTRASTGIGGDAAQPR